MYVSRTRSVTATNPGGGGVRYFPLSALRVGCLLLPYPDLNESPASPDPLHPPQGPTRSPTARPASNFQGRTTPQSVVGVCRFMAARLSRPCQAARDGAGGGGTSYGAAGDTCYASAVAMWAACAPSAATNLKTCNIGVCRVSRSATRLG